METKKKALIKPLVFLKETQRELKKASWPSKEETIKLTMIVILVSSLVAVFVGGLDFGFTKLMQLIIGR